jgi:hypothetical protein
MVKVNIEIKGLDGIRKSLEKAPEKTVYEMSKAVQSSLNEIRSKSLREAPIRTGDLRKGISTPIMETRLRGKIEAREPYSAAVHEGSRPHIIRPKSIGYRGHPGGLGNRKTGFGVYNMVHHPGNKPNRFFDRSIDKANQAINQFFTRALQNVINSIK